MSKKSKATAKPNHTDAIGYLCDLAAEIDEPWFNKVCDCAAVGDGSLLDEAELEHLFELLAGSASYECTTTAPCKTVIASSTQSGDFLEELSGFRNFKLLGESLRVGFEKRITLIFGANGSGKSSVCEALKVLADHNSPDRPLNNVREATSAPPSFSFKFRTDTAAQSWSEAVGFGSRSSTIKYFDADVASKNISSAIDPGRVIVLTPFRLQVFEYAKALAGQFRDQLESRKADNADRLEKALGHLREVFGDFPGRPLAAVDANTVAILGAEIATGQSFTDEALLEKKQAAATELEKATSEEGLKLLRAEHRELKTFLAAIKTLIQSTDDLWALDPVAKKIALEQKKAAQEELAGKLVPEGRAFDQLVELIRAASSLCDLEAPTTADICPLCKRDLETTQISLFKQYHALLEGQLEEEISALRQAVDSANGLVRAIQKVQTDEWEKSPTLKAESVSVAKEAYEAILAGCDMSKKPPASAKQGLETIRAQAGSLELDLEHKTTAIEAADKGRSELQDQLVLSKREIEPLRYAACLRQNLPDLTSTQELGIEAAYWEAKLKAFPSLLKRITESLKTAHEELVVGDFETRLDQEYESLTEKKMESFGVALKRIGAEARVTVSPHIGGNVIEHVLSEGELRVHALALFFAELETCPQSVLVFDDPISSFYYDYIDNYCTRLRDYASNHPAQQIVVLTHNWEFFVRLQATFNSAGLNGDLAVQVLENCTTVDAYSERVEELRSDITTVLSQAGEPTKATKEVLAGKMRRLIEAIVNTYVFAGQRHQYKQRSQTVSVFQCYTKVVPLLPQEATALSDLYAKLSVPEHDDPRNAYINADKATFQVRYDAIKAVEDAVKAS
jgi:energy-coupling factor transporter ATP-binding protein EcfA2